ncbi:MAG: hypothetical protein FWD69_12240 [Polyangiaceae bacterium]|nr:hypothetical protein [Polyangiaceae bacterium]
MELRSEQLIEALNQAIGGRFDALYAKLCLASGLPGTRANLTIAHAFANDCAALGKKADRLLFTMAGLHPDEAPGATELEYLPLCGVLGLGARGAGDPSIRDRVLRTLHDAAEDPRFRVRDVVPMALARIGEGMGDALVIEVAHWMDGFFQAAAVLLALTDRAWLSATTNANRVLARFNEAYVLAREAPRSAARWPGRKALVDALSVAPAVIAARYGAPVFDMLVEWSSTEMPELREAIEKNLSEGKLKGRYTAEIERVRAALRASATPPRDPTRVIQGMRSRGTKRGR